MCDADADHHGGYKFNQTDRQTDTGRRALLQSTLPNPPAMATVSNLIPKPNSERYLGITSEGTLALGPK